MKTNKTLVNPEILRIMVKDLSFSDVYALEKTYNYGKREWGSVLAVLSLLAVGLIAFTCNPVAVAFFAILGPCFVYCAIMHWRQEKRRASQFRLMQAKVCTVQWYFNLGNTVQTPVNKIVGEIRLVLKGVAKKILISQRDVEDLKKNLAKQKEPFLGAHELQIKKKLEPILVVRGQMIDLLDCAKDCLGNRIDHSQGVTKFFHIAGKELLTVNGQWNWMELLRALPDRQ